MVIHIPTSIKRVLNINSSFGEIPRDLVPQLRFVLWPWYRYLYHYNDGKMSPIASQTISLRIVYAIVYSGVEKYQSSASLAFARGIHRSLVNSPHKGPVMRKMFPFDTVIMASTVSNSGIRQYNVQWMYKRCSFFYQITMRQSDASMRQWNGSSLVRAMDWCLTRPNADLLVLGPCR